MRLKGDLMMSKEETKKNKGWLRGEMQGLETIRIETVGVGLTSYVPKQDVLSLIEELEDIKVKEELPLDYDYDYLNYMNNLGLFANDSLFSSEKLDKPYTVPVFVEEYIVWAQEMGISMKQSLLFKLHGFSDEMSPEQVLDVSAYTLNEDNKKDYIDCWEVLSDVENNSPQIFAS